MVICDTKYYFYNHKFTYIIYTISINILNCKSHFLCCFSIVPYKVPIFTNYPNYSLSLIIERHFELEIEFDLNVLLTTQISRPIKIKSVSESSDTMKFQNNIIIRHCSPCTL